MNETELITRAQQGDTEAYAALVQRYQALAMRAAYLVTGDVAEAEDAVQQAFIKAYYALDRLRPGASLQPWLLRIVTNEASNLRKAAQRRSHREARAAARIAPDGTAAATEEAALASEERRALVTAFRQLRAEDRLVLGYRYVFDLSEAEMAEALGVARGTVKSRLARALERLRQTFARVYPVVLVTPDVAALLRAHITDIAGRLPAQPGRPLTDSVLGRIRPTRGRGNHARGTDHAAWRGPLQLAVLALVLSAGTVSVAWQWLHRPHAPATAPTGIAVVAYGGDLTEPEREEVARLLGGDQPREEVQAVTRDELRTTLQTVGLPAAPSDAAVSSVGLTCREPKAGLRVSTQYITRIPAAVYAQALLVARPIDATVVIAAPSTRPVSGETALVGVLKIAAYCQGGMKADPERERVSYEILKLVRELAGQSENLNAAALAVVQAAQAVVEGRAPDDASLANALDDAAVTQGLRLSSSQRTHALSVLSQLARLDYGSYGTGYRFHEITPNEIEVVPAGQAPD